MSGRLYKTLQYLLNLLRWSRSHLLRLLRLIAHQSWPAMTQKRSTTPNPKPKPRALPAIRPRALTPPPDHRTAPEAEAEDAAAAEAAAPAAAPTSAQLRSPLFNLLPLEIRRLVYRHALAPGLTHIVRLGHRLGHVRCRDAQHARPWPHRCWGVTVTGSDLYHGPRDDVTRDGDGDGRDLLALVTVCRRVYAEAIPVLYGGTTFSMLHLESVVCLADTILPQRLNAIRSVELGWYFYIPYPLYTRKFQPMDYPPYDIATWERVWSILANMEGLMELRVDLVGRWIEPLTTDEERQLLGPAMKVKRPRVWDMRVDWEDAEVDWEAQGAPFRVVRCEGTGYEGDAIETSIWSSNH